MANIVRRSAHQAGGKEVTVKVISKNNPNGPGKLYDVTVDDQVEYRNAKSRSDALQLYRTAKKDVKKRLKNGGGGSRGGFPGLGGGGGMPGLGGGGGQPSFPGMMGGQSDDDDDDDSGFNIPGL